MLKSDVPYHDKKITRQRDDNKGIMAASLNVSDRCFELNNSVLFARPLNKDAILAVYGSGKLREADFRLINVFRPIVLSSLDKMKITLEGQWIIEMLSMSQATTLFSFLDYQSKFRSVSSGLHTGKIDDSLLIQNERNLVLLVNDDYKSMMEMLIFTLLHPHNHSLESLFSFIRNLESYWIAHFLLSQVMNEDEDKESHKIGNASKIYGVSESYFRKLCHHAFTRGPKKQLRLWRAAHSALQLIEKDNSISDIAGNNGYASSSHFSSEIKSLFGITPREFKKLEGMLHE